MDGGGRPSSSRFGLPPRCDHVDHCAGGMPCGNALLSSRACPRYHIRPNMSPAEVLRCALQDNLPVLNHSRPSRSRRNGMKHFGDAASLANERQGPLRETYSMSKASVVWSFFSGMRNSRHVPGATRPRHMFMPVVHRAYPWQVALQQSPLPFRRDGRSCS